MGKFKFLEKFKWFEKLKKVKHIEIYLVVLLVCAILLIWFVDWGGENKTKKSGTTDSSLSTSSTLKYAKELETRLETALSTISGAGNVKVMITFDGVTELVLAKNTDEKKSSTTNVTGSGSTNKTETTTVSTEPILITENGATNPIVLMEILPEIKGVIVVAQGADNIKVKLDLLKAVQALLSVNSSQVEIFTGN